MQWISHYIDFVAGLLAGMGVPQQYRQIGALGLLYGLVTLLVFLLIFLLFRLFRRRKKEVPPAEQPPAGEGAEDGALPSAPAEAEDALREEATGAGALPAEEVAAEEEAGAPLPVAEAPAEPVAAVPQEAPVSLFERMRTGLAKTHSGLVGRIDSLLGGRQKIDADLLEELEEILITADFGMKTTQDLMQALEKGSAGESTSPAQLRDLLKEEIRRRLRLEAAPLDLQSAKPFVLMVVGVNGVGKTTTIGKLAHQFASQGKKVVLGAGDTFRAAAADQLVIWGERAGVEVIRHQEGADPAAVAFDAAKAALAREADLLILDTAGRLHTKVNLMEELKKVRRVLGREIPDAPQETLLVLDATTGQNALVQARLFKEAVEISGIALTKLDGTARGGMVVAIGAELGLPVRYVGIGEGMEDLRPFDPDLFVDALFERD